MTDNEVARFWANVSKKGPDDCWPWLGTSCERRGSKTERYGQVRWRGKMYRAHRVAVEIATGQEPIGGVVMHHCDNTLCVNQLHLKHTTQRENVLDAVRKGRSVNPYGSWHGRAGVTEEMVLEMRRARRAGEEVRQIAKRLGITRQAVTYATKRGWKHLDAMEPKP